MKKKIIFMLINMNIGGTEKALLNMIEELSRKSFDITILLLEQKGDFITSIPKDVKVEYFKGYESIKNTLKKPLHLVAIDLFYKRKIIKALTILFIYSVCKIRNDRRYLFKYLLRNYERTACEYDVAVAYAGPMDLISYFVINKIKAKKKLQWVHFDISKIGFNNYFASKIYKEFNKIFVVSEKAKDKLVSTLPELEDKIETFTNIVSSKMILKMANEGEGFRDNYNGLRILTVGRLSKEKGQDLIIKVLAKLKEAGYEVRWYCLGDGQARSEYELLIKEYKVESDFILLGAKTNPYPFMKECDIYVQPSRHEGYCITLSEARCFNKPIICTNFTGSSEQISQYETGIIVDFNEGKLFSAVKEIIDNKNLRNKIKGNLEKELIETVNEIDKLIQLV
ncbi:glycosyltransferase [Mesobacillus subterraneus]|uniref:glycosyltransferase n=1 Tax=Mesobacillus subterraneus TaxID=285983 RepID=UPI001CFDA3C3|nr:glycosyltransferase [Mesobacillus subterraneus]